MDLRRLRYFVAVAEERNFRRAAERLNISQPPLSQQIHTLEEELGAPLFIRDRRSVALTAAGEVLLRRARAILASVESAAAEAARVGRGEVGCLVISFMSAAMLGRLTGALGEFRMARPGVEVQLRQLPPKEQIAAVAAGHVDAGFLSLAPETRRLSVGEAELIVEPVWEEELLAALPLDHPLANQTEIALGDLAAEAFITLPRSPETGYFDQLVELCRRAGFEPRLGQEVEQLPVALALIAAGYGVGLTPLCVREEWPRRAAFLRLDERPRIAVTMIRRSDNHSPALAAFRKLHEASAPQGLGTSVSVTLPQFLRR
jgi:DNA-binding transcriptional LysR family regulator